MVGIIYAILNWDKLAYDEELRRGVASFSLSMILVFCMILPSWAFEGRTMIFNAEGVEFYFWKLRRKYLWSELKTIRLEYFQRRTGKYKSKKEDPRRGIVFSTKKILKPHDEHPVEAATSAKYLFYVTFPVDPDDRTERSDSPDAYIEPYEVDEEEFMTKMREWNIPIENCLPEEMKANYKW
jgi:hypothetical protein